MKFQDRVANWMQVCFGPKISADQLERGDRFIEEAIEMVQAAGYSRERIHLLIEYVYSRPVGELKQEVGGVMVTLGAFCQAHGIDMQVEGEREIYRIESQEMVQKIRNKQKSKPQLSPLPIRSFDDDFDVRYCLKKK